MSFANGRAPGCFQHITCQHDTSNTADVVIALVTTVYALLLFFAIAPAAWQPSFSAYRYKIGRVDLRPIRFKLEPAYAIESMHVLPQWCRFMCDVIYCILGGA
jgi:hypothetical protein